MTHGDYCVLFEKDTAFVPYSTRCSGSHSATPVGRSRLWLPIPKIRPSTQPRLRYKMNRHGASETPTSEPGQAEWSLQHISELHSDINCGDGESYPGAHVHANTRLNSQRKILRPKAQKSRDLSAEPDVGHSAQLWVDKAGSIHLLSRPGTNSGLSPRSARRLLPVRELGRTAAR